MATTRPYVSAAFACEKLLVEKDDVFSAIRMVDTFFINPSDIENLPQGVAARIRTIITIAVKADSPMDGEISLAINTPDGQRNNIERKFPISLSGERIGANLIVNLDVNSRHIGWTWIDVMWNGDLLTRVPIRLVAGDKPESETPTT